VDGFLVRLILNKDLVGLFFARSLLELMVLIDECTEPEECEYIVLPPGSVHWTGPAVRIPIPIPEETAEDDGIPWNEATISDSWWHAFYASHRWTPIDRQRAAELKRRKPKKAKPKSGKIIPFPRKKPADE
jgi:hypothetical protein